MRLRMRMLLVAVAVLLALGQPVAACETTDLFCGSFTNDTTCSVYPVETNVVESGYLEGCVCGFAVVEYTDYGVTACHYGVDVKATCVVGGVVGVKTYSGDIGILHERRILWEPVPCGAGQSGHLGYYKNYTLWQYAPGSLVDAAGRPQESIVVIKSDVRAGEYSVFPCQG